MLQVLPENISNLIAAGEVVTRPASVVKELMENAVDAGASQITVIVTDAGRTLIQVIDDGCGMTADEARLCFERHATSKIASAEDLEHISTFGFRGEALPSIAAVAEVTLKTCAEGESVGSETVIAASRLVSQQMAAAPQGCNFAVRNLFYNVPARRKFLKSDNAELKHITTEFLRVALTRPSLSLKLISNGRDLYDLLPVANEKRRIHDIFGREVSSGLTDVATDTSLVRIHGYIGAPEDARKTAGSQFMFINGRYFRSPYLHKAVCKPYEKLIPEGYTPSYFLYLEMDPQRMDVNIHPAKTEVKFEDETVIFEIVTACVREGLGRNSLIPTIDFDIKGAPEIPTIQSTMRLGGTVRPPRMDYSPLFNPFEMEDMDRPEAIFEPETPPLDEDPARLFAEEDIPAVNGLLVLRGRYILSPREQGVALISVSRARERIFYERYLEQVLDSRPAVQETLFPVTMELPPEDCATLCDDEDAQSQWGFDIRSFGPGTIAVYGIPAGHPADEASVRSAVEQLLAVLRDEDPAEDGCSRMAASMARSAAACRRGDITQDEAHLLLDELMLCHHPMLTPDGRKTMAVITFDELDKRL